MAKRHDLSPQGGRVILRLLVLAIAVLASGCAADRSRPSPPSERVHIFYYNWYGAPPMQATYVHWQQGGHFPPDAIGANYYPQLGPYGSSDPTVLKRHMEWIREAGAGVVTLTWWGQGSYEDQHARHVLDAAAAAGLTVNFHLEPYAGFTPARLEADVAYLLDRFGDHPAFYRARDQGDRPMFYVFEALRHDANEWRAMTDRIRRSDRPVILLAQTTDLAFIVKSGFDGGYTYDALATFKNPAYVDRWPALAKAFRDAGKLFIPSIGPGYWDDRAVPRGANEPDSARTRDSGTDATYQRAWAVAAVAGCEIVTITSFNEWHEGSQIEPAVAKIAPDFSYPGYANGPRHYIELTARLVQQFERARPARHQSGSSAP